MLEANANDFAALGRAIANLPGDIKAKAISRAMRRVADMARTRIVRRQAPRLKLPQKFIRDVTTARFNAGGNTAEVVSRSGFIPLYKLGATQTSRGVRVRGRGSYAHAFLAGMNSGHKGVFHRAAAPESMARLPIQELFGPNPAHDITNNDDVYPAVLADVMHEVLLPRVLHEVARLLPKGG